MPRILLALVLLLVCSACSEPRPAPTVEKERATRSDLPPAVDFAGQPHLLSHGHGRGWGWHEDMRGAVPDAMAAIARVQPYLEEDGGLPEFAHGLPLHIRGLHLVAADSSAIIGGLPDGAEGANPIQIVITGCTIDPGIELGPNVRVESSVGVMALDPR